MRTVESRKRKAVKRTRGVTKNKPTGVTDLWKIKSRMTAGRNT